MNRTRTRRAGPARAAGAASARRRPGHPSFFDRVLFEDGWPGHRRAEATPFFERQCRHDERQITKTQQQSPLRKQLVPDVTRGCGEPDPARLAPGGAVDLALVADGEAARRLLGDEDGVAHPAAGMAVPGLDLFPEAQPSELQLRQLFPDLALEAVLLVLPLTLAA